MKRKKTIYKGVSDPAVSDERPVPSLSWDELVSRAEGMLDEHGVEAMARRRATAEKILRRQRESGCGVSVDVEGVKYALAAYYDDCMGAGRMKGFRRVFAACGVRSSDFFDGKQMYPELGMVFEYIAKRRDEQTKAEASELGRQAQESQRKLVTEEGCDLNQRAVELSLRASMRDVYGDDAGDSAGGGSDKKTINYHFPNLRATWIIAPSEIAAKRLAHEAEGEVVDVK